MARPKSIIIVNSSYQEVAEKYYKHLLRLGYNPLGCRSRYNYLCEFLHWLEQKGVREITKINTYQITGYYEYISERPSKKDGGILSPKTTYSHMKNIRDFFEMLLNEGQITRNPTSAITFRYPRHRAKKSILTQTEITALYTACKTAQERAILSLAYGCGLRVSELTKCNIEDIRLKEKTLVVPEGKGNKRRVVPMSPGVATDLADYFFQERELLAKGQQYSERDHAFMLNSRGGRMQKWTYNRHLKRIIKRTGRVLSATEAKAIKDKQISIHNLRHSIATHLIEQGIAVEQVRQFLGHSQLETTQIYTHISTAQLKNLIQ